MCRYISLVWSCDSFEQSQAANQQHTRICADKEWHIAVDRAGLRVYYTYGSLPGDDPIALCGGRGIVFGTLFDSSSDSKVTSFDDAAAEAIARTDGQHLVDHYWGSYVLLLANARSAPIIFMRGPMSTISCFWTEIDGVTLVFSEVADCVSLGLREFSLNWDSIVAQVVGGDYLGRQTGLKEVQTLLPGEGLAVQNGKRRIRTYWSPAALSQAPAISDFRAAVGILAQQTQRSIRAWIRINKVVLVQLSGGLDSSIVLACAVTPDVTTPIIGVNFWGKGPGDERRYARSMADKAGVELIEVERAAHVDLRRFLTCARTANPPVSFVAFDVEPRLIRIAKQRQATAILSGELGDDIFGHSPTPGMLAECMCATPISRRFLQSAVDYAAVSKLSLWRAISQAMRYRRWQTETRYWSLYRYKRFCGITNDSRLASEGAIREYECDLLNRNIHPWFEDMRTVPAGRAPLFWSLIQATSTWFHSPFSGRDADLFLNPLASQPLVETACAIPSRFHFRDGANGSVAREAFASSLSDVVLTRGTGKGTPDLWIRDLIYLNRTFLKELFFDGILVHRGLLDTKKLQSALSGTLTASKIGPAELIKQLYVESWLRGWSTVSRRVAA